MTIHMPHRIRRLPRDKHHRPIPWFVLIEDGVPDFRIIRHRGVPDAHRMKLCWICGQPRGAYLAFTIGPMCAINRITSEPPSHRDCAEYAAQACPFLATPSMKRRERDLPPLDQASPGVAIDRNPGAAVVWVTRDYHPVRPPGGGVLFGIGEPTHVAYYAHGREATPAEVWRSIDTGLPALRSVAELQGPDAVAELKRQLADAERYLPPRPPAEADPGQWAEVPGVPPNRLAQSLTVLAEAFRPQR